jgi:hypothetical protein
MGFGTAEIGLPAMAAGLGRVVDFLTKPPED